MKTTLFVTGLMLLTGCANQKGASTKSSDASDFARDFNVSRQNFSSTGRNQYFVLEPGYQLTLRGKDEGKDAQLVVVVLNETKEIDGVPTRIVEERETANGVPTEISRNYFAIDKATNDVYYFGEDVDIYKNGKLAGHEGGWHSGENGAHYGLFMPAKPRVGQKFYQELAPKTAMDRCEIVSATEHVSVPGGNFDNCVKTRETTPLEPGDSEYKMYGPNVGLLVDGNLKLANVQSGMK
jgi:hypothetical protein